MLQFAKLFVVVAVLATVMAGMPATIAAKPVPGMAGAAVDNAASAHDRRTHRASHRHRRHHRHAHHS